MCVVGVRGRCHRRRAVTARGMAGDSRDMMCLLQRCVRRRGERVGGIAGRRPRLRNHAVYSNMLAIPLNIVV